MLFQGINEEHLSNLLSPIKKGNQVNSLALSTQALNLMYSGKVRSSNRPLARSLQQLKVVFFFSVSALEPLPLTLLTLECLERLKLTLTPSPIILSALHPSVTFQGELTSSPHSLEADSNQFLYFPRWVI